jgi:hypothetical protein
LSREAGFAKCPHICRTKIGVNNVLIIIYTGTKLRNKEHKEKISQDKAAMKKDRIGRQDCQDWTDRTWSRDGWPI